MWLGGAVLWIVCVWANLYFECTWMEMPLDAREERVFEVKKDLIMLQNLVTAAKYPRVDVVLTLLWQLCINRFDSTEEQRRKIGTNDKKSGTHNKKSGTNEK
jgi:hypothetical protein